MCLDESIVASSWIVAITDEIGKRMSVANSRRGFNRSCPIVVQEAEFKCEDLDFSFEFDVLLRVFFFQFITYHVIIHDRVVRWRCRS